MGQQPYYPSTTVRKVTGQLVQVGEAVELAGVYDRKAEIEAALEKQHQERIEAAQVEAQRIIDGARQEAQALLQLAETKAEELIANGHARRQETLQQAYDEGEKAGFAKGYADGYQQAEAETLHLLASAQTVMDSAYMAQTKVLKSFKQQAVRAIETIAKTVVAQELSRSPEQLLAMVENAIEQLGVSGKRKVVVSIETLDTLKHYGASTAEGLDRLNRLSLEADPMLDANDVYVLSEAGNFVVTPEAQVEALTEPLAKAVALPTLSAEELNAGIENLPPTRAERQALEQTQADEAAHLLTEGDTVPAPPTEGTP